MTFYLNIIRCEYRFLNVICKEKQITAKKARVAGKRCATEAANVLICIHEPSSQNS